MAEAQRRSHSPQSPTQWGLGPPGQLQLQQRLVVRPLQTERLRITLSWCINNKTNTLTQTHCLEMIFLSYTVACFVIFFTLSETQHRSFGVPAHFNRELSGGYRRGKGSEWENPRAVFLQKDENLKLRHWRIYDCLKAQTCANHAASREMLNVGSWVLMEASEVLAKRCQLLQGLRSGTAAWRTPEGLCRS